MKERNEKNNTKLKIMGFILSVVLTLAVLAYIGFYETNQILVYFGSIAVVLFWAVIWRIKF
ncbi:hypothetical protein DEALK_00730 [Dehalogenimonas alkenigignens]|uniref:Uncharacterized protein n=1 Tax=Dehalogenimonas alkenigignens TaxID=1217799 RepID=A0A0W0GKR9_9CHLR|nr:hypothetical protein DEALK_00730 [Dehalogenimonas alkenigignens]